MSLSLILISLVKITGSLNAIGFALEYERTFGQIVGEECSADEEWTRTTLLHTTAPRFSATVIQPHFL
jgi:hypothetical protein